MPKVLLNKKVEPVRSGASYMSACTVVAVVADAFQKDEERSPATRASVTRS